MSGPEPPVFAGISLLAKGKPVEKQGRKVSGLKGKTYDSGAAGLILVAPAFDDSRSDYVDTKFGSAASYPKR